MQRNIMSSETNETANDITNLQESFQQQQEKITALKKLVHKSGKVHGSSKLAAQEKVKHLAERLKRSKARSHHGVNVSTYSDVSNASGQDKDVKGMLSTSHLSMQSPMHASTPQQTPIKAANENIENAKATAVTATPTVVPVTSIAGNTPSSEKMTLMRQQLEQNRLRIAQKATSKQHLEQLVTQLKVKFDNTQQCLANATELGKSMNDLSNLSSISCYRERHKSSTDLTGPPQPFNLEKERIKFLENRCRLLEKQLEKKYNHNREMSFDTLSLESKISELHQSLIGKEKMCEELEEKLKLKANEKVVESKHQLKQTIENVESESIASKSSACAEEPFSDMIGENNRLHDELDKHVKRIKELTEVNDLLEISRCELSTKVTKLEEELRVKQQQLSEPSASIVNNCTMTDDDDDIKSEMAKQIQQLMNELNDMRKEKLQVESNRHRNNSIDNIADRSLLDKIPELERTIEKQKLEIQKNEEELMEKRTEVNVLNANLKVMDEKLENALKKKPLFSSVGGIGGGGAILDRTEQMDINKLQLEMQQLKQKLDESNKISIKMKLKCKQTEKALEELKKRNKELDEENTKWQLTMNSSNAPVKSNENNEDEFRKMVNKSPVDSVKQRDREQFEMKLKELENIIKEKTDIIEVLQDNEQSRVKRDLLEIQWEEDVKQLTEQLTNKEKLLEAKDKEVQELQEKLNNLDKQKTETEKKLEHYINENIELLDKIEKLSKSSSSAESIEIVERLTQQEHAELEEYNKAQGLSQINEAITDREAVISQIPLDKVGECISPANQIKLTSNCDNLVKLREESTELKSKIELFTNERKEVLDKMEYLSNDNYKLQQQIECLKEQQLHLNDKLLKAEEDKQQLEEKMLTLTKEKDTLTVQVAESQAQKAQLSQGLTSLQKSSEVVAALDNQETLFDKCEKSLAKLNSELKAYRKANDRNAKFNVSKKLAKEAENAHTQLSELLQKVKEASNAVETVTVVETVVAVTAPNGKALAEYEQLTAQNRELQTTIVELRQQLDENRDDDNNRSEELQLLRQHLADSNDKLKSTMETYETLKENCKTLQQQVEQLSEELKLERMKNEQQHFTITELDAELKKLRHISDDYDRIMNDKEMSYEKQIEQLTRLRLELENKCETYGKEMEILRILNEEQKQQLIENFKEHEQEMDDKLQQIEKLNQQIKHLQDELKTLQESSQLMGRNMLEELQQQCIELQDALKINKALVQEQLNELANKQETIDTLNEEIMNLYKSTENINRQLVQKTDEIIDLENRYEANRHTLHELDRKLKQFQYKNVELERNTKEQKEQLNNQQQEINKLQAHNKQLEMLKQELEQRNKEQLDKLRKYAANLKKKVQQCQEYEKQIKEMSNCQEQLQKMEHSIQESERNLRDVTKELNRTIEINEKLQQELDEVKTSRKEYISLVEQLQAQSSVSALDTITSSTEMNQLHEELHQVRQTVDNKNTEMEELKRKYNETEHMRDQNHVTLKNELHCLQENLQMRNDEIESLRQSLMAAKDHINGMEKEDLFSVKNNDYENLSTVLADKAAKLEQAQCELEEYKQRCLDLNTMIQEKNALIENLETKCSNISSSFEMKSNGEELDNLRKQLENQEQKLNELIEELKTKSIKFEKSKAVIKERNMQIQRLQAQLKDYQEQLAQLPEEELLSPKTQAQLESSQPKSVASSELETVKDAYNKLNEMYQNEKTKFQDTITRLETLHDGIQAKLQEDMAYIETLEQENNKFKEKICRLEECVAIFEERRASMERKVKCINAEMQRHSVEHTKTEDELIYRLNMLSEHDDIIARRLLDSQTDKETLEERIHQLQVHLSDWQSKYNNLEKDFSKYKMQIVEECEKERNNWLEQLEKQETELQALERNKSETENKLLNKTRELDDLENQLDEQLQQWNTEKRTLTEQLERTMNTCTTQQDELARLRETLNDLEESKTELEREITWLRMQNENSQQDQYEVQELRLQFIQDKTEIENMRDQIDRLIANHATELDALRTQITELDSLRMQVGQNQTDDQVFIETENKRLTDLLAEKVVIIENLQRQNLQLQLAVAAAAGGDVLTNNATATVTVTATDSFVDGAATTGTEVERLHLELAEKSALVSRLQQDYQKLQSEYNKLMLDNVHNTNQSQVEVRQRTEIAVTENEVTDVIPAPPMFFNTDASARTPFDDINFTTANQQIDVLSTSEQSPTIEDLQRNVSDLEKHAQDLEHKLAARNQQVLEYEERLRDLEQRYELNERELLKVQLEHADLMINKDKQHTEWEQKFFEQDQELKSLQLTLKEREEELAKHKQTEHKLFEDEQLKKSMNNLQKQIIPNALESDIQPTLDMFFGNTGSSVFENFAIPSVSSEPVVEDVIIPKKTYECQPPTEDPKAPTPILDLGVDWSDGWANEAEAASDVEHYPNLSTTQASLISREKQLELELQDVNEHLKEIQLSLEQSEDQKKDLQAKYNKLGKKLKEYKAKVDELQSLATAGGNAFRKYVMPSMEAHKTSSDLDAAIEEELKHQIKTLEANLMEQRKQLDMQIAEKEKLLKRIDVLTAGNDRMAEMKERQDKEVHMYQSRIKELQDKLQALEDWGPEATTADSINDQVESKSTDNVSHENDLSSTIIKDLEDRISTLSLEVQDLNGDRLELQALLEEERMNLANAEQIVKTLRQQINAMQESQNNEQSDRIETLQTSFNDLLSKNDQLNNEIQGLKQSMNEKEVKEKALTLEIDNLQQIKQKLLDTEAELSSMTIEHNKTINYLQKQIEELHSEVEKHQIINKQLEDEIASLKLNKANEIALDDVKDIEELSLVLLERDSEIEHLKQRINDLMNEDPTEKLVLEILSKNQEIQLLKIQIKTLEEDKQELENNSSRQHEHKNQETQTTPHTELNVNDVKVLQLHKQIDELLNEKQQMEVELQVLNQHVLNALKFEDQLKSLTSELDAKNQQICELQNAQSTGVVDYAALNAQWEAIIEQRCGDIAKIWQDHLAQRERDFKAIEMRLQEEITTLRNNATLHNNNEPSIMDCLPSRQIISNDNTTTSTPISTSSAASGHSSADDGSKNTSPLRLRAADQGNIDTSSADMIIEKMQVALESQELEIVTLKEQLAIRSAEYAQLAAQYDPFKLQTSPSSDFKRSNTNNEVDMVAKSQLDLALYILHQRDMRCEEMTLELTSLMEERDTLQLKLSNTLRQLEAIKTQAPLISEASSSVTKTAVGSQSPLLNESVGNISSNTINLDDDNELNEKLSQLQTVKHSKDKMIKEEREQRLRQMEQIQQDISKIPSAAVSELIGSDLTQTTLSPSTALFNWLWGTGLQTN